MREPFIQKVRSDLKESRIDLKVIILFVPIAFFTYVFHESGHWLFGELTGNNMTLSLNNSAPVSGYFNSDSGALWSAVGGPLFTILQALVFLVITRMTKSVYAYSFTFFAVFSRFFSIILGGIDLQDEAGIASMLDVNKYMVATVVLTALALILWKSIRIMKLNIKALGYFTVLGVLAILIVIGVNEIIS